MSEIVEIELDRVVITDRLREVDADYVSIIAASMRELGQIEPITVRKHSSWNAYIVVTGAHRTAAVREAELPFIRAIVTEMTDDEALLAEIDENLIRRELNPLDRAVSLAQRQAVYERLHPETANGGDRKSAEYNDKIRTQTLRSDNFTEEAAEKAGLSRRTVQDAIALVKALTPEFCKTLSGTPLAQNAAQLKALAKQPPSERAQLVEIMRDKGMVKVLDAKRVLLKGDAPQGPAETPKDAWMRKMRSLWDHADSKRWQDDFLARIGAVRTGKAPAAPLDDAEA